MSTGVRILSRRIASTRLSQSIPGQHDVDDGGVVGLGLCQFEGGLGVDRVVHREAGLPQAGDDERRDRTVVFDDEDPHAGRTERPRGPLMTFKLLRRQMRCEGRLPHILAQHTLPPASGRAPRRTFRIRAET